MESVKLEAKIRQEVGKDLFGLRDSGDIPAVLYGHGIKNKNLKVRALNFEKIFDQVGESGLIDLVIDGGEAVKVLAYDVQRDLATNRISHVDFYQVKMKEKITAKIKIEFIGEPPAVKERGGVLIKNIDELEVKCLPQDLVREIKVDLSGLKEIDDILYVKDLKMPATMEIANSPDDPIVSVVAPRKEEEEKKEEAPSETVAAEGEATAAAGEQASANQEESKK